MVRWFGGLTVGHKVAGQRRADGTVAVGDGALERCFALRDCGNKLASVVVFEPRDFRHQTFDFCNRGLKSYVRSPGQQIPEVEARAILGDEQVRTAASLGKRMKTKRCEYLAHFFRQEPEVGLEVFGVSGKFPTQFVLLRGDAHGTAVEVAVATLDASDRDEHRRAECELVGAKHGGDHDVAARTELSVHLQFHAVAQVVL